MARPKTNDLTERELEVIQVFWDRGESTVAEVRDVLAETGRNLAHTTVATLIKILLEKGYLRMTHDERPFRYEPARSYEDVSGSLLTDLIQRVFGGSREQLLQRLVEQKRLSRRERASLKDLLGEDPE